MEIISFKKYIEEKESFKSFNNRSNLLNIGGYEEEYEDTHHIPFFIPSYGKFRDSQMIKIFGQAIEYLVANNTRSEKEMGVILEKIKDPKVVEDILTKMEDKRETKVNISLKRTFERDTK